MKLLLAGHDSLRACRLEQGCPVVGRRAAVGAVEMQLPGVPIVDMASPDRDALDRVPAFPPG